MSCVPVADDGDEICANCGKQGSDAVKLKDCMACRLVKYCGVDCQKAHRKQHKKVCKRRATELKDEQLYSQGHERPEGDFCPICTLPIPLPMEEHSGFNVCCMKRICGGCNLAAQKRGMHDCAFCRAPLPENDADSMAMVQARVRKNDAEAINYLGEKYCHGHLGLQKDVRKGVELYTEAAELGSIQALFNLGAAYYFGNGVEKNTAKVVELYEKAAMHGHVESRCNLGCSEGQKQEHDRAVRHFMISAKMGDKASLDNIKRAFKAGVATKELYTEALKGYQDAVEGMKSHDRDEAIRSQSRHLVPVLSSSSLRPEASMARSSLGDPRTRKVRPWDGPGALVSPDDAWKILIPSCLSRYPARPMYFGATDGRPQGEIRYSIEYLNSVSKDSFLAASSDLPWTSTAVEEKRKGTTSSTAGSATPSAALSGGDRVRTTRRRPSIGRSLAPLTWARASPPADLTQPAGGQPLASIRRASRPSLSTCERLFSRPPCPEHPRRAKECWMGGEGEGGREKDRRGRFNEVSDRFQLERNIGRSSQDSSKITSAESKLSPDPARSTEAKRERTTHTGTADQLTRRQELVGVRPSGQRLGCDEILSSRPAWPPLATQLGPPSRTTRAAAFAHFLTPSNTFFVHSKITGTLNLTMSYVGVPDVVPVVDDGDEICANCGKRGSDTVKLKNCTACRIVKYCGVDCQKAHRKQHRRLFVACCMQRICYGCDFAVKKRGMLDCAFCRAPLPGNSDRAGALAMVQARVAKKDPVAINFLGEKHFHGQLELQKDARKAVELWTEAAELGNAEALFNLGVAHSNGHGVQQDMVKAFQFYNKAAMQGHAQSRHKLGYFEEEKGNYDRAVRHWLISAKMGHKDSVQNIKTAFMAGLATKEQCAEALKGYQDAVEEMKRGATLQIGQNDHTKTWASAEAHERVPQYKVTAKALRGMCPVILQKPFTDNSAEKHAMVQARVEKKPVAMDKTSGTIFLAWIAEGHEG
ncbi:hypothetical protein THAOC_02075, partial [Thalassiosira oceanica]